MVDRVRVRAQVLACTACSLASTCTHPVPFSGANPSPIVVIGEAPGREEDERGAPFVGPAGRLLRVVLDSVMEGEGWNETIGYANVVSCYPARTPHEIEVVACRKNLTDQMKLFAPSYGLVVGGVSLSAFWPKLRVGEMRGRWWSEDGLRDGKTWLFSAVHPAAVLRSGGVTSKIGREFREDLETFRDMICRWGRPGLEVDCVKCGRGERRGMAEIWERNIGVCRKHAELAGIGSASSVARRPGGGVRRGNRSATSRQGPGENVTRGTLFG
jgi:uracil-DNA glycosylase